MGWFTRSAPRIRIAAEELFHLLHERLSGRFYSASEIRLSDRGFTLAKTSEAMAFIRDSARFYRPETGDCDDLAMIAKARACEAGYSMEASPAFGIVWTTERHAFNWCLDESKHLIFLDVQHRGAVPLRGAITLMLA